MIAPCNSVRLGSQYSGGFALFTALVFLLVMTMLGVAMYGSVVREQGMAGNMQQKVMALTAATVAAQHAKELLSKPDKPSLATNCSSQTTTPRVCSSDLPGLTANDSWSAANGHGVSLTATNFQGVVDADGGTLGAYAAYPQYYIHRVVLGGTTNDYGYWITAWGVGGTRAAVAIVRMFYIPN